MCLVEGPFLVRSKRGVYTYILPNYSRHIRGRSLGLAYERLSILDRIAGKYPDREAVPPAFADLPRIFLVHSDLRLVVDLQNCVKAQHSRAYARKVMISNLQEMARTVAFIQEQGIDSIDELNKSLSDAQAGYHSALSSLRETEAQLKSVNEAIHHLGVYLSRKKLYREFLHAKNKGEFRTAHRKEIDEYEGSSAFLKKQYQIFSDTPHSHFWRSDLGNPRLALMLGCRLSESLSSPWHWFSSASCDVVDNPHIEYW